MRLEEIARAAGYAHVARVRDALGLRAALAEQLAAGGPSLLLVETAPESGPPAPRIALGPQEMTARLRRALGGDASGGAR